MPIALDDLVRMLRSGAALLRQNRDLLSQLDSATGDGDHGATMCRVADAIFESATLDAENVRALLDAVGWSVLSVDGGSASPLVGSFLLGMAEGAPSSREMSGEQLADAFEAGLVRFRAQTQAAPGDKTMLDALLPAVEAARAAAKEEPAVQLAQAAEAASEGAANTRNLQARFGRARNLGPRSIGSVDPGATSISLLFRGFHSALVPGAVVSMERMDG